MTDSLIINWGILAFVFLAGFIVGGTVVIGKVMRHARHLYAPKQPEKDSCLSFVEWPVKGWMSAIAVDKQRIKEIGYENARREAIERSARAN